MAYSAGLRANTSPLKRTFDHVSHSTEITPFREGNRRDRSRQYVERRSLSVSTTVTTIYPTCRRIKRRTLSTPSAGSMMIQTTATMSDSIPSFMSVYSSEDANIYSHALSEHEIKREQISFSQFPLNSNKPPPEQRPQSQERRNSLASITSCSTGSSPTTTSSTFDSPLMAEQSPDSSPESASSAMPPKSFQQPQMRSTGTQTITLINERQDNTLPLNPSPLSRMDEPKKNLKNLTLDMKLSNLTGPGSAPVLGATQLFSAPTSPFREPPRTGRKKPTNLTIRTPGFNQLTFGNAAIPPTPGQKSIIHQAQPTPLLPALASPTAGPVGGMRLPLPNIAQHLIHEPVSSHSAISLTTNLPNLREEDTYGPPKSQEAPEKGYTSGPCQIYDTGVFLYLEPTKDEASKFDTVINVAKEIRNPFETSINENNTVMSVWRTAGNRQSMAEPQTAMSEFSFKSAFEWPQNSDPTTPTTPRPSSSSQTRRPEYLHVKWDHNSEILEDLFPLCRLIDDRVQQGKKVLIHCQLGVSRSASLIIAYGLYKGYESDFHSMYMSVKKRSQWVGPNMSLIYQLTDFKSKCDKGEYVGSTRQPKPEWFVYTSENGFVPTTALDVVREVEQKIRPTQMNESRPKLRLNKELPPVPLFNQVPNVLVPVAASNHTTNFASFSQTIRPLPPRTSSQEKSTKRAGPRQLPFREKEFANQSMIIPPHRPRIIPDLTFAQPSMDLAVQDEPAAPSLFSPRATEFMAVPFGVTGAGDLVTTTPKTVKPPPGAFPGGAEWRNSLIMGANAPIVTEFKQTESTKPPYDPRSPHQQNEIKEILRSIDDFL